MSAGVADSEIKRGPYRTGDETRRRILDAALRLFGRDGFHATSIRQLSEDAKVAVPAIAYHYTDKAGLYHACAVHVVQRYADHMGPLLNELGDLRNVRDPAEARSALHRVVVKLSATLVSRDENPAWAAFMMREMQVDGGDAYEFMLQRLWLPGLELIAALVARARSRQTAILEDRILSLHLLSGINWQGGSRKVSERFLGCSLEDIPADIVSDQLRSLISATG